ncbi:carbonic anhydrase [Inhella proteolytica]|uniref:carbonic anhydrase n=1 Tax=Inhella proteolytica TaxID=2795029 RepID=A0A931J617_9BURK|nr:carbonic anhydrase family protein [Inhella proteolytica]MBH9578921.1 carbonic anhydrase family protein [Inhella proteolytica]
MRLTRLCLALALLAAPAVHAVHAEEPAKDLRQRLAEKLEKEPGKALQLRNQAAKPGPDRAAGKPAAKSAVKPHWGYTGEGAPDRWGELAPENRLCAIGTRQTPIDIRDTLKVDLEPIQFEYRASSFSVIDTGHSIQVKVEPGNFLSVMQRRYELQQFHFHKPSEERINGRGYDLSAHLVHKDEAGRLAVLAVLLERGSDQAQVQQVLNHLPLEKHQLNPASGTIDLNLLLPAERGYYTFMGSLTTPPCSEDVLWMVMRQPVPVGAQQLAILAKLYPMNARPIQPAGGRIVKESF